MTEKLFNLLWLLLFFVSPTFATFEEGEFPFDRCSVITQDRLLNHFERIEFLGSGGESASFSVRFRPTGNPYALVLKEGTQGTNASQNRRENLIKRMVKNERYNPHQAKIFGYFWIINRNYHRLDRSNKKHVECFMPENREDFLNRTYENDVDAAFYYHEAIVMELGISNLKTHPFLSLNFNSVIVKLYRKLASYSFKQAEIIDDDDKERNYVFIETEGQNYFGEALNSYDFWAYQIDENLFVYLPTPTHIIKRIDYGGFRLIDFNSTAYKYDQKIYKSKPRSSQLNIFAKYCKISEEEFINRFCQRPEEPGVQILSIQAWK
ncbi:MAG: hypothetical protein GY915_08915 [bacterium]|nr:hypothetical protein [bacterium]